MWLSSNNLLFFYVIVRFGSVWVWKFWVRFGSRNFLLDSTRFGFEKYRFDPPLGKCDNIEQNVVPASASQVKKVWWSWADKLQSAMRRTPQCYIGTSKHWLLCPSHRSMSVAPCWLRLGIADTPLPGISWAGSSTLYTPAPACPLPLPLPPLRRRRCRQSLPRRAKGWCGWGRPARWRTARTCKISVCL